MILNILYDHNGNFMWSSIATAFSLFAAILAYKGARKSDKVQKEIAQQQIDANLKASARIDWITKVRIETAGFVTNCLLYMEYSPTIEIGKPIINSLVPTHDGAMLDISSEPDKHEPSKYKEIIEDKEKESIRVQLNNSGNRLILYFGPDRTGENERIVKDLEKIINKVNEGTFYKNDIESEQIIKEFRNKVRAYLKKEWDKAKEGN